MDDVLFVVLGVILALLALYARHRYASFAAQRPEDYGGAGPQFDIRKDLNGPILCDGVIYGPTGRVVSRFVANFDVSWSDDVGVMKERFHYDDGSVRDRQWNLRIKPDGEIEATADDVVGAGIGTVSGPSIQLRYKIQLPEESGGHVLDTIDWMYLTPDGTIVNRSQFRKFGIQVAELVATMRPHPAEARMESEAA